MTTSRSRPGVKPYTDETALDFELVDVRQAREAMDQHAEDIATVSGAFNPEPQYEAPPRRSVEPAPAAGAPKEPLPAHTVQWIVSLPAAARPLHLFMHYPKLGNRLALLWENTGDAQRFFDELLMDTRGTRQGFPKEVFEDLMRLQHLLNERQAETSGF
ncbi:MAG: hypothetical protein EPO01_10920 [Aquabacterium sp.]|jgi:hypothetical protein|nr:MAG: hypothetical protein EPO12_03475 [Aquabacterium sp.]TAL21524.1 MAG: hypothetical protein EPO01_10920 [Aquabacterium sp.]